MMDNVSGTRQKMACRDWPKRKSVVLLVVAAVLPALLAVACTGDLASPVLITPTRAQVIGTWKSTQGAVLTLNADGRFVAQALPSDFGAFPAGVVPTNASCDWHVGLVPAEPPGVVFNFSRTIQAELFVERDMSTLIMYYDRGDPDQGVTGQYQFRRVP